MAIGETSLGGGNRELARVMNGLQNREKLLVELLPGFVADQPGGPNQDLAHRCPSYALNFILCDVLSRTSFCPSKDSIVA